MGGQPLAPAEAWEAYGRWRRVSGVVFAEEPDGCEVRLEHLVQSGVVTPRRWTDAYLAAFAQAAGWRMVSFDKDFSFSEGLSALVLDT